MSALAEIEARRQALGVSIDALERAAGIADGHYHALLGGAKRARHATLARMRITLQRLKLKQETGSEEDYRLAVAYRLCVALAARELGRDAAAVHRSDPGRRATHDAQWMAAAEVRRLAVYLMNCGAGFRQTEVARAAGLTKQAVQLAVKDIEARRDEGSELDRMLVRLTAQIQGEW